MPTIYPTKADRITVADWASDEWSHLWPGAQFKTTGSVVVAPMWKGGPMQFWIEVLDMFPPHACFFISQEGATADTVNEIFGIGVAPDLSPEEDA